MAQKKVYGEEFKIQAVKLGREIGFSKAAKELGINTDTLYVSAIFDCYDLGVLGLAMAEHMKAELCVDTVQNAWKAFPAIRGAVLHSDRRSQYTSACYRAELARTGIIRSMNSDGGRCHDNARCEAM